jgi:uncharacterized protein
MDTRTPDLSYAGPVVDAFLHTPWLGGEDPAHPRGDTVDWKGDRRLARVMATFHHADESGEPRSRVSTTELLAQMDASGVERGILPAKVYYRSSPEGVQALHEQLAAMCQESSGRLRAVGTIVPPELGPATYWDVMATVRMVHEAHDLGFVGIHLTPSPWGMAPNHKWLFPALAACAERNLAVYVHVGMPGPLWPMDLQNPAHLDEVALAFPDLRIIAHHIGDPWTDVSVRLAARHRHVYICTSAWSPKRYPRELLDFLEGRWQGVHGSDKVLYASDFPLLDMQRATQDARALPYPEATLRAVMYANAMQLFWEETSS